MALQRIELRDFSDAELILDDEETKAVLKFFFPSDVNGDVLITRDLRNFAQGLLVEAVDASYAMGYIEILFRWVAQPGNNMKKALRTLAKKAFKYWFKHLGNQSLMNAKIYETIRSRLSINFRSPFNMMLVAKADRNGKRNLTAFVDYYA